MRTHLRSYPLRRLAAFVIGAAVLFGGWRLYDTASMSLQAEANHHAAILVIQLATEYVERNDGAWPRSWEDLKQLPHREWAMYSWPRDAERVMEAVAVNFSADPDELAIQSVEEFDSIRPIGPSYAIDEGSVRSLLKSLRTAREARAASGNVTRNRYWKRPRGALRRLGVHNGFLLGR